MAKPGHECFPAEQVGHPDAALRTELCPVNAVTLWRSLMLRDGRTIGPLFVRVNADRNNLLSSRRPSGKAIANVVNQALWYASKARTAEISGSMPFTEFLERLRLP